jgi:hypothetical protein
VRHAWIVGLAAVALIIGGCAQSPAPSPSPSEGVAAACGVLPPRTSPTEFPVAVLYVRGDDLPPVIGEVEWLGGAEPVTNEPRLQVHLERFTVLQTQGQAEVSVRMSDGVQIASWTVDAVPAGAFRAGDLDSGRVRLTEGSGPTGLVCVPVQDGAWLIIAEVTFADDAGAGTYYWRLNVTGTPEA